MMMSTTEVTERYEALRTVALAHGCFADRQGLALLRREGMAAWATAWTLCSARPTTLDEPQLRPAIVNDLATLGEPSAVVRLLASMALSTMEVHPS